MPYANKPPTFVIAQKTVNATLALVDEHGRITGAQLASHLRVRTPEAITYLRAMFARRELEKIVEGRNVFWRRRQALPNELPGDLRPHLRAPSIFAAGARAAHA